MRELVKIKFGSHLYGTSTPASDLDFKGVHVPERRDILLGRVKPALSTKRAKAEGEKNVAGEIDSESYSLLRFLQLAAEGQTVAMDVLFAPSWADVEPCAPEWSEVRANRHRLLTRRSAAFVGYCRQQANKYGIKGSRVAAARKALDVLKCGMIDQGATAKLQTLAHVLPELKASTEHVDIIDIEQISGEQIAHLEVCNRKMSYRANIKSAVDIVQRLVDEYGARALAAERHEGIDWKALSHAVRVGREALELLGTGNITFPLPDAEHILKIKKAELPYKAVAEEIENLLTEVEAAALTSKLPEQPDMAWIEDFVSAVYMTSIVDRGRGMSGRAGLSLYYASGS